MSQSTVPSPAPAAAKKRIALPAQEEEVAALRRAVVAKLTYAVGKDPIVASDRDWFVAAALTTRDKIVERWFPSTREIYTQGRKRVYYLSLEFLIGRLLFDSLSNLRIADTMRAALNELGVDLDRLREIEPDAALGNGGLGRLAACFLESMATLGVPAYGYGIRYQHGLFRQAIKDGWQQEYPENWLNFGHPWEFERPEAIYPVGFGGHVEASNGGDAEPTYAWKPGEIVEAVAYDTAIVGWRGKHVITLRLWNARAPDPFALAEFNRGDHIGALAARSKAAAISQVLYPSDETPAGQELRLRQEFFFSSASLQDMLRRHLQQHGDVSTFGAKASVQLNDTHPAISILELMRLLVDVHQVEWAKAWAITQETFSYTNHTLLPEALETWPIPLLERLLPRHVQIVYLLNWQHLNELRAKGFDEELVNSVSLIDEQAGRRLRMGTLAFVGSHKVNGVSALHSNLMKETVFKNLNTIYPDRITNKTNGITFRRWLYNGNPGLTDILRETCGERVLDNPDLLKNFAKYADDASVQERVRAVKFENKLILARIIQENAHVKVDPHSMFDVQIKRIHEYKRQLLNILQTVALYGMMRAQPMRNWAPRVKIFAGKAAPSYHRAKLIIKLAHDVAKVINGDPTLHGMLKVAFLPNYNVSLAERIIPAADLSEQISTAGMEASGTGNMKLSLNGALTIGTLDGANVEIKEQVGDDHIFIFGMTAAEAEGRRRQGIDMRDVIAGWEPLREVLDEIGSGVFSPDEPGRYRELIDVLTNYDHFLVCADFASYQGAQRAVADRWRDPTAWWRSSIINTANMAWFSSDRTIREYADEIWHVPIPT